MTSDFIHVTGRMVSGDAFKQQPDKTDPKTGNIEIGKYFVGVAIPKVGTPGMDAATTAQAQQGAAAKAAVEAIAQQAWPNGEHAYPNFSMKIKDGDGLPQNKKEGYPGCWIFGFSQSWPFRVYDKGCSVQLMDPKAVKRGDYIRVPFTSRGNDAKVSQNQTPGVYLNAELIEFTGHGKAIQAGIDPSVVMAQIGAAQTPTGASDVPIASGPPATTGGPGGPPTPGTQGGPPGTQGGPPAPSGTVESHPGFLDPPVMTAKAAGSTYASFIAKGWKDAQLIEQGYMEAAAPAGPADPPVPAGPVMTAKAAGMTYESFIAKGWKDDPLRQHGYIV